MRVLIVKTSSLGDIIHALPAVTDAAKHYPEISFDWVVEEAFAEIPLWHPHVANIIPIAIRRWRKQPWHALRSGEWRQFYKKLRSQMYDYVIDAQYLVKSAFVTRLARGIRCGLDEYSAREPLACLAYQQHYAVAPKQHAVTRIRQLFAQVLNYPVPTSLPDYGIDHLQAAKENATENYLLFLHGTTWETKHWPEIFWQQLIQLALQAGYNVKLPWGNNAEYERAVRLAAGSSKVEVLPKLNLNQIAAVIVGATGAVAVDTGLGHLAAALSIPTVSLYSSTATTLTGTFGRLQFHQSAQFPCSPCFKKTCQYQSEGPVQPACFNTIAPESVWQQLNDIMQSNRRSV